MKYHGRTYDLKGCKKNMPKFDNVVDFPDESDNLKCFSTIDGKGFYLHL